MWTMKFSSNGQYLATAGQDAVVRVWKLVAAPAASSTPHSRRASETPETEPAAAAAAAAEAEASGEAAGGGGGEVRSSQPPPIHSHLPGCLPLSVGIGRYRLAASFTGRLRCGWVLLEVALCTHTLPPQREPLHRPLPPADDAQSMQSVHCYNQLRVWWGRRAKGGEGAAAAKGVEMTAEEVLAALQVQDVFNQEPYRVWSAHEADVLDLCWSATQVRHSRGGVRWAVWVWHGKMRPRRGAVRTLSDTGYRTVGFWLTAAHGGVWYVVFAVVVNGQVGAAVAHLHERVLEGVQGACVGAWVVSTSFHR